MFDAHPPFQIDGNFGGARAIAEMLMQARGDRVRLLPALPRAWPTGSVKGLRAPARTTVDLAWRSGALVEATLTSDLAGERTVHLGEVSEVVHLEPGRPARLRGPRLLRT
jgi:alpha-L-fucosidase 2